MPLGCAQDQPKTDHTLTSFIPFWARVLHKNSERPHHDMFCVAKTTNQSPSQPPYSAVGKVPGFKSQGRGLDPGPDHLFFRIFLFISKEKVRACFFAARINQPTCYYI